MARRRRQRKTFWIVVGVGGLIVATALFVVAINLVIVQDARPFIAKEPSAAPSAAVAIVLGGGIDGDGTPSVMLTDRLDTALLLYHQGKVKTLLLSGDGRPGDDQVAVMQHYLEARGVPTKDLLIDGAGFDTRASMLRAEQVFQVRSALIPTQGFHLARAVYLARSFGIRANGVSADIQPYSTKSATVREWAARVKAFLQTHL